MKDEDELRKKIEALEQENRALRDAVNFFGIWSVGIISERNFHKYRRAEAFDD